MGRSIHPTSGKGTVAGFFQLPISFCLSHKVMVPPYAWLRLLNEQRLLVVSVVLSLALATANCHENQGHPRLRRSLGSNFGKRITSSLVAELGKRPKEMFSFGIGKRSISDDEMEEFLAEESHAKQAAAAAAEEDSHNNDLYHVANKRDPYAFGLGKRAGEYNFGLGKKRDPYAFGLGKRSGNDYAFGMGKKDDNPYAFGLGKRGPADRYAFGLGKRDPYAFGLGKRDPYAFGLGKRDP